MYFQNKYYVFQQVFGASGQLRLMINSKHEDTKDTKKKLKLCVLRVFVFTIIISTFASYLTSDF